MSSLPPVPLEEKLLEAVRHANSKLVRALKELDDFLAGPESIAYFTEAEVTCLVELMGNVELAHAAYDEARRVLLRRLGLL